jgi:hypothetical protein
VTLSVLRTSGLQVGNMLILISSCLTLLVLITGPWGQV